MKKWMRVLADLVFPAGCEACGHPLATGHDSCLCPTCLSAFIPPPPPLCTRCGVPLASALGCLDCRRRPPAFAEARAIGLYLPGPRGLNPLARAVQALKYKRRRVVASTLGRLLAASYPFAPDALLVPVPLHRTRLRERGFNQALLLARVLARARGLDLAPRALVRTRPTTAQPGLGPTARRHNLADAFATPFPELLDSRSVVLVDDVLTTGATANACARALLRAAARRVDVYTVGRAPWPGHVLALEGWRWEG